MEENVLKLKDDVCIEKFDTSDKNQMYILFCNNKRWQITEYTYNIIILIDGKRNVNSITKELSTKLGRNVSEDEVNKVIKNFLIRRGILSGTVDTVKNRKTSSYLWMKVALIKSEKISKFKFLSVLFYKQVSIPLIFFGVIFFILAIIDLINKGYNLKSITNINGMSYIVPLIVVYVSTIFHEFGHASACMYYNIKPKNIGFAIYFIYPCFYADVSDAWHLKRFQRAVVDAGGIYFQFVFFILVSLIGVILNVKGLIWGSLLGIIFFGGTLNPFIKMDGYWMISDLIGIPNLHELMEKFLLERIYIILGIKYKYDRVILNIKKKEKILFLIYVMLGLIFITCFIIGIGNITVINIGNLYRKFQNMFINNSWKINNSTYGIFNDFALLITSVLLIRIVFKTIKNIVKLICNLVMDIKKNSYYKN